MSPSVFFSSRLAVALAFTLAGFFASLAHAQPANSNRPRPPRAQPAWVTPPVSGPGLEHHLFDSPAAGEKVSYLIYLPPGYEKKSAGDTRYPVTYWLHGIGGSQQGVPGFCERLTQAIETGQTPPMIVVFVNGMVDSFYCDAATIHRPVETVVIQDLIPHIDSTWRTIASREGRAIEGFSMGGFGAGHFGFKYPELFGAISLIDAALVPLSTIKNRHAEIFERVFANQDDAFIAAQPTTLLEKNISLIRGRTVIRQIVGPLLAPNQVLHEQLTALGVEHEYQVFDGAPHNQQVLYDRLGNANWAFYQKAFAATAGASISSVAAVSAKTSLHAARDPAAGLLYYAKADYARPSAEHDTVVANPFITGALFQIIWSEVEKKDGVCDWREVDQWLQPWLAAGKKVALRVIWSTSGAWAKDYYKTPTPQWVREKGAVFAYHARTRTEIPLIWDPIYKKYAWRFLEQVAARYGDNPNLVFIDVTPGAETNPYRFGTINRMDPGFKDDFVKIAASDGRRYNDALWLDTLKEWVDASARAVPRAPLLVTLNIGGLPGTDRLIAIGDYCVNRGFYVGQNGLAGRSYVDAEAGRTQAFLRWSGQSRLFFEMVQRSGGQTGTLMSVMQAAERIQCNYLNVYPEDVLQGTRGNKDYDPKSEEALKYGAAVMARRAAAVSAR